MLLVTVTMLPALSMTEKLVVDPLSNLVGSPAVAVPMALARSILAASSLA